MNRCTEVYNLSALGLLPKLKTLDMKKCDNITSLSPLAALPLLEELDISDCQGITDLSHLASISSLRKLDISKCQSISSLDGLQPLIRQLESFSTQEVVEADAPAEIYQGFGSNLADLATSLEAHYQDLKLGATQDLELRVVLLGNGSAGKTQLCRRLNNEAFDPKVPSTHGVQLQSVVRKAALHGESRDIRLNLWDSGGQDLYHGSHALFFARPLRKSYKQNE